MVSVIIKNKQQHKQNVYVNHPLNREAEKECELLVIWNENRTKSKKDNSNMMMWIRESWGTAQDEKRHFKGRHARMAPLKISSLVTRKKTGTVKKENCTILNLVNLEIWDITKTTSWSILRHILAIENKPAHQNIIFIM